MRKWPDHRLARDLLESISKRSKSIDPIWFYTICVS